MAFLCQIMFRAAQVTVGRDGWVCDSHRNLMCTVSLLSGHLRIMALKIQKPLCVCAASNSTVFQDVLAPFSAKLAQKNASPNRAAVPGCQVLSNVPTLSGSKSAAAAATPPTAAVPPVRSLLSSDAMSKSKLSF